MAFVLLVPYAMIRKLKFLAPFSLLANVLTACGLVIIVQWCVRDLKPINELPQFNSWATLPLYFGTAVYAFEGIGVVSTILHVISSTSFNPRNISALYVFDSV